MYMYAAGRISKKATDRGNAPPVMTAVRFWFSSDPVASLATAKAADHCSSCSLDVIRPMSAGRTPAAIMVSLAVGDSCASPAKLQLLHCTHSAVLSRVGQKRQST